MLLRHRAAEVLAGVASEGSRWAMRRRTGGTVRAASPQCRVPLARKVIRASEMRVVRARRGWVTLHWHRVRTGRKRRPMQRWEVRRIGRRGRCLLCAWLERPLLEAVQLAISSDYGVPQLTFFVQSCMCGVRWLSADSKYEVCSSSRHQSRCVVYTRQSLNDRNWRGQSSQSHPSACVASTADPGTARESWGAAQGLPSPSPA